MIQFITDKDGHRTAAVVPIEDYEAMRNSHAKSEKERILQGLKESYQEMLEMEKEGRPGKSRQQVMKELRAALNEE